MKKFLWIISFVCTIPFLSFGQTIKQVRIGNQIWMTENLNVDRFRNGDPIPLIPIANDWKKAGINSQAAWCYYDNDSANGEKYGKLYNWYAVVDPRGLCPSGWHVPSDAEWKVLVDFLGGENIAGGKLKAECGWQENGIGTNSSGFSGIPGGSRIINASFYYKESFGYWWSSSEQNPNDAIARSLFYINGDVGNPKSPKTSGYSVRCLKD